MSDERRIAFDEERGFLFHDGPNKVVPRYETVWMVLSVDEHGEGLMVVPINGVSMPLATGKESLVPTIKDMARQAMARMDQGPLGPLHKGWRVAKFKRVE